MSGLRYGNREERLEEFRRLQAIHAVIREALGAAREGGPLDEFDTACLILYWLREEGHLP